MSKCKFTIITVCYNAENNITDTILSVLDQTFNDFEYIIKDGQSADGTMDIVRCLTDNDNRVMIIEGKDQGIYDAMNIAVESCAGEYILFLNAGDTFHEKNSLQMISQYMERENADVYYGNFIQLNIVNGVEKRTERVYNQNSIQMIQYAVGKCLCHQTMLAKRELFDNRYFDLDFRVCADREWQLYFLKKRRKFRYLPIIVSDVLTEGFSSQHIDVLEKETRKCLKRYCKQYLWIYNSIMLIKKNSVLRWTLQKLESLLWVRKREK